MNQRRKNVTGCCPTGVKKNPRPHGRSRVIHYWSENTSMYKEIQRHPIYADTLTLNICRTQVNNALAKYVYILLPSYVNEDAVCYPSIQGIAKRTGLSSRTVIRCINYLEDNKFLHRERGCKGNTTLYDLTCPSENTHERQE